MRGSEGRPICLPCFTTRGAVASILTGSVLTVVLIVLSPTVWVDLQAHLTPAVLCDQIAQP